ncbi:SUMO1 sentrin specific peptidase 8 [Homalodisca vitripennis]|nr:SUMO1 sentrin specific peptidase 8 [Homalodisca vitripennis]
MTQITCQTVCCHMVVLIVVPIQALAANVMSHNVENLLTQTEIDYTSLHVINELLGEKWVSDDILYKYFDFLNTLNNSFIILNPVIGQAIKILNEYDHFLDNFNVNDKNYLTVPLNDAQVLTTASGSHWSTLMYHKITNTFYYYDSMYNYNLDHAKTVMGKLSRYMNIHSAKLLVINGVQQKNSYDCSIYSVLCVEGIVLGILNKEPLDVKFIERLQLKKIDIVSKRSLLAYTVININSSLSSKNELTALVRASLGKLGVCRERDDLQLLKKDCLDTKIRNLEGNVQSLRNKIADLNNELKVKNALIGKLEEKRNDKLQERNYKDKSQKSNQKKIREVKVELYADSQGRELPEIVGKCSVGKISMDGLVTPGADICRVYNQAAKSHEHPLILLAGTNDMIKRSPRFIYEEMENKLRNLSMSRSIFITTIPPRFDVPQNNSIHDDIAMVNNYIREIVVRMDRVHLIDLDAFRRIHFTRQGLHLNYKGKKKLSYMIIDSLGEMYHTKNTNIYNKNTMTGLPVTLTLSDVSLAGELDLPIKIVEENINKVFQEYQCDESVGFSHCISADLNDERNMSAGIARMFKEKFGRPSVNDCINSHLTCQKTAKGTTIFGLITKSKYFYKPKLDDYNLAFKELIQEFKKRGLKKLICSPMGCVRDEIPPEHFVIKIIEFHKITGASVDIITYDEHASRRLRGGLSYSNFVKKLRDSLSNTYQQGERTETDPLSDALHMATTTGVQADVEIISADDLLLTTPMPSPLQLYRNPDEVQCVKSKAFNEVLLLSPVSHICADKEECNIIMDSLSSVNKQLDQTPAKSESPLSSPFLGWGSPEIALDKSFLMKEIQANLQR